MSIQLRQASASAAELDRARAERERLEVSLAELTEERDALLANLGALTIELASVREEAAVLAERNQSLDNMSSRLVDAEARVVRETAGHAETRRVLAQALADLVGGSPAASSARAVSLAAPESAFLLFAPVGTGYELLERTGLRPEPGAELEVEELSGARFAVAKVGRSPLPLDARPCLYLERLS